MPGRAPDHYAVLGVPPGASTEAIRRAYRERARVVHPDAPSGSVAEMAAVNEAYRVLADPGRRALYDRARHGGAAGGGAAGGAGAEATTGTAPSPRVADHRSVLSPAGPARVPWRMMAIAAVVGSALILVTSVFNDPPSTEPPDGILRPGSCVALEPNGDAREVGCGGGDDLVVEVLVPLDGRCPTGTLGHRDRLGLGIACLQE